MIDAEQWQKVKKLFNAVLELEPGERKTFLKESCAGDDKLRQEVESLLAAHEQAPSLLEKPAPGREYLQINKNPAWSMVGKSIGPYRLKQEIGRGGMGVVYLAERADEQYQKQVAIKVVKRGIDTDEILRRFRNERQILAVLEHPNIARLLDGGTTENGLPYLVMDYIEGMPIDEYCDARKLNTIERLRLFCVVCTAVHFAHQNLIVHRDLKPSNILVTSEGEPKLLDFGIAKLLQPDSVLQTIELTKMGIRVLTPEYASPEQIHLETITTASDVYSLGVLLYKILTAHRPYHLKSCLPKEIERVICEEYPEKPSIAIRRVEDVVCTDGTIKYTLTPEFVSKSRDGHPDKVRRRLEGDIDNIVLKALHKEPRRRYVSVEQFSEDIRRHLEGMPVIARKDTWIYKSSKFIKRHKAAVAVAALFLILIISFSISTKVQSVRIAREHDKAKQVSEFLVDLFQVSDPGEAKGDTITAREILDKGAKEIEKKLKDQPLVKTMLMNTMGKVYQNLGLYDRASLLIENALRIRRRILGEKHPDVAESLNDMATLLHDQGEYEAADSLFCLALAMRRKFLGDNHKDVAESLHNYAMLLKDKGDYDAAEPLLRQALVIRRRLLGEENLFVTASMNELGTLLYSKGNFAGAEQYFRNALAIECKIWGEEHPDVTFTMNNLAFVLYKMGDREESVSMFRKVLNLRRKLFGKKHPNVATSLSNLAYVLADMEDYEVAASLYREALEIRQEMLGNGHPNTANLINNLAVLYLKKGELDTAALLFRQTLEIFQKSLGKEHPKVAQIIFNIATLLQDKGEYPKADSLYGKALSMKRTLLGEDHPDVAAIFNNLASLHHDMGDYDVADSLYRQALKVYQKQFGEEHPLIASILNNLERLAYDKGNNKAAKKYYRRSLELR